MSTLTMKPVFSTYSAGDPRRDVRGQHVQKAMRPSRERTIAVTAGTIAVTLVSVLAPMAGNPAKRLFALDATPTIPTDETFATQRPFELGSTTMGPAIDSEALIRAEADALYMPVLKIDATPIDDEVVIAPQG